MTCYGEDQTNGWDQEQVGVDVISCGTSCSRWEMTTTLRMPSGSGLLYSRGHWAIFCSFRLRND